MTMVFWGLIIFATVIFCNKVEFVGSYRVDILSSINLQEIFIESEILYKWKEDLNPVSVLLDGTVHC